MMIEDFRRKTKEFIGTPTPEEKEFIKKYTEKMERLKRLIRQAY